VLLHKLHLEHVSLYDFYYLKFFYVEKIEYLVAMEIRQQVHIHFDLSLFVYIYIYIYLDIITQAIYRAYNDEADISESVVLNMNRN